MVLTAAEGAGGGGCSLLDDSATMPAHCGAGAPVGGVNGEGAGGVLRQVVEQGVAGGCKASKVAEAGEGDSTVQRGLG